MNPVSQDGPATVQTHISIRNATTAIRCRLLVLLLMLVSVVLWVCGGEASPALSVTLLSPTATRPPASCSLGTGLREETAPILVAYKDHPGLVMTSSSELAGIHFPQLEGWIRVLGVPSLAGLQQRAEWAEETGVPYEALGYGLETGKSTPDEEWQDLVGSTQTARAIANQHGKLLVVGPGLRLMSQNEDKYPQMAALADIWIFQTQRLQINPPGPVYRREVARIVNLIRSGNPSISIWAQITLPPDREPYAKEWLAYRQSVVDLVDGTYIGAYTWDSADPHQLSATIQAIFATICANGGCEACRSHAAYLPLVMK
jgi:hypothetical protein